MAQPQSTRDRRLRSSRRRGVSLVEVLVVLVVLIVGFAALARLFPEGFANLGFTANATMAHGQMIKNEEELRGRRENLPNAVVGIDPNTGLIRFNLTPQDLFTAFRQYPVPGYSGTPPDDERFSNVNQARRVIGEHIDIPPATTAPNGERASLYRPLFGPLYSDTAMAPASLGIAAYSGTALRRVEVRLVDSTIPISGPTALNRIDQSDQSELQRLGDFGYGIDYQSAHLYFNSVPYARQFKVDFTYHNGSNQQVQAPATFSITVAAGAVAYDLSGSLAGASIDPNSDFLYRYFVKIATATAFGSDPYEFKVYDSVFGLIGFNPVASSTPLPLQQGRGLTAQIDYDVDDWHILHEDANISLVPADPDGSLLNGATGGVASGDEVYFIKLAADAIKKFGDTEDTINFVSGQAASTNTFEYQGLQRYYPDTSARTGTPGVDLVIVDLETGYQIDSRTLQKTGVNTSGEIDYASGNIHLWKNEGRSSGQPLIWQPPFGMQSGPGAGTPIGLDPAGRRVRIYYRTYNDMAVATYKPYNRYYMQTAIASLQEREFFPSQNGYLLFPPLDGEKTVAVDYRYLWQDPSLPSGSTNQQLRTVIGELHQINSPTAASAPVLPSPYNRLWWARVDHADPVSGSDLAGDTDVVAGSVQITGVRGASLHTHVVWKDGSRWRHRQRATVLTREESR